MIYFFNSLAFAALASIWSKTGWANIFIAMVLAALAVINAIGAYPAASKLLKF